MSRKRRPLKTPRWIQNVLDRVSADDSAWFKANPHARIRHRAFVPGEEGAVAILPPVAYVEVEQLAPGVRARRFIYEREVPETIVGRN